MRRQVSSAKSTNRSFGSGSFNGLSPYDKNYKGCLRIEQRELIFEHQRVSRMTRRDLEDQYIKLCDDQFALKRENRSNQEKIKRLLTKILRLSSLSLHDVRQGLNTNLLNRAHRDLLSFEEKLQICIFDLEIQNSQLQERLQIICKRHGIPPPSQDHHQVLRPGSEMFMNHSQTNLSRGRAKSCHQINGRKSSFDDEVEEIPTKEEKDLPLDTIPVKLAKEENTEKIQELEEKNERLAKILNDFNEQLEQERLQNKEMSYKLKELSIRKHISENIEVINLKEKLEQTKMEFKKRLEFLEIAKERNEKLLIEERIKLAELTDKLKVEEEITKSLSEQLKQIDPFKKQIADLREQLIESESEKQSLKTQHERFALLLKESVQQGDRVQTLKEKNSLLQSQLEEAKANEMAVTHSKTELVEKIIKIQDENDRISIELEGLRSLLADNEYKEKKRNEEGRKRNETRFNLQDVAGVAPKDRGESPRKERRREIPEKNQLRSPSKTIGVNTEPVSILKEGQNRRKYQLAVPGDDLEGSSSTSEEKNATGYDEPLTLDSERSSLINFAETLRSPEKQKRNKINANHLELLERAALYGPLSTSSTIPPEVTENQYNNSLTDSISIESPRKRFSPKTKSSLPEFTISLDSFTFSKKPKSGLIYYIEVTLNPNLSFHCPSGFHGTDNQMDFKKSIKVTDEILNSIADPDHSLRFLLLEKPNKTSLFSPSTSSISSSAPDEETISASTNILQCRDVAYGSWKCSKLAEFLLKEETDNLRWTGDFTVPFFATRYSHPEIGQLDIRLMIDGVPRLRQLLTNAKKKP